MAASENTDDERLDSVKSLEELDLGENIYVKNSALVDVVHQSLNNTPLTPEPINNEENKNEHHVLQRTVSDCDENGVPIVFRNFLRRFSENDGIVEEAMELR